MNENYCNVSEIISDVFLSNQNFLSFFFYITVIFIHFYNVLTLDSLKISSVLNSRLPDTQWLLFTEFRVLPPGSTSRQNLLRSFNSELLTT